MPTPGPSAVPEAVWLPFIRDIYPDLLTKTYFLPPIHFRPVPRSVTSVAGQVVNVHQQPLQVRRRRNRPRSHPPSPQVAGTVFTSNPPGLEPQRLQDSDLQDDQAQYHVLRCLQELSESSQQVMMVIFQLKFRKYLNDLGNPVDPAVASLPTVAPLPVSLADGECDILAILRHYGILIGEIKSVGGNSYFKSSTDTAQNQMILTKVEEAVGQLNNQATAVSHLVSDMPPLKVTKVLILPNITSSQLLQALNTNSAIAQALCQCLQNAQDLAEAVSRCLCKDQMSPGSQSWRGRVSGTESRGLSGLRARQQLSAWWQHAVLDAGPDPSMSNDVYERLLARFCGPATTVDIPTLTPPRKVVRSLGHAVAETGLIMSGLALYPEQVDLLNDHNLDSVFLVGPPGTGKTVLLIIKGMQLLRNGEDVYLLSICTEGRSVMILAEQQLKVSMRGAPGAPATGTVHRHHFDFNQEGEMITAVNNLSAVAGGNPIFILVDEVGYSVRGQLTEFFGRLKASVSTVSLWAAGLWLPGSLQAGMKKRELTLPLRCPPTVTEVVEKSDSLSMLSSRYSTRPIPAATEGPDVIRLSHSPRLGRWSLLSSLPGHTSGSSPKNCKLCGETIARILKDELRVGQSNAVQWKDVLILTDRPSPSLEFVQALDHSHIPVRVVEQNPPLADLQNLALAQTDTVMVTHRDNVLGLERRIVVGIGIGSSYQRLGWAAWLITGLLILLCLLHVVVEAAKNLPAWATLVVVVLLVLFLMTLPKIIRKWADENMGNVQGLGLVMVLSMTLLVGLWLKLETALVLLLIVGLAMLWLLLMVWTKSSPSIIPWFVQKFGEQDRLLGASRCTGQLVLIDDFAD